MEIEINTEIEYRISLSIRAVDLDLDVFYKEIKTGAIKKSKHCDTRYWCSEEDLILYGSDIHISDYIETYLMKYEDVLELSRKQENEDIVCSIAYYAKEENLKGLSLNNELISLFEKWKIILDFDVVSPIGN